MEKCEHYRINAEKHYLTDFEKGVSFAKTGKYIDYEERKYGECWGTKNCDRCNCGGDKTKCDFYEDVRNKALQEAGDEKYRLQPICKFDGNSFKDMPAKYGLAIEKRCKQNAEHVNIYANDWYVIMTIKYDAKDSDCKIEIVEDRILDIEDNDWKTVKELIQSGIERVSKANEEENNHD